MQEKDLENDYSFSDAYERKKRRFAFSLVILAVLSFGWFIFVYQHLSWLKIFQSIGSWLTNPVMHYTPIQVDGSPAALLATIMIVIFGTITAQLLLADEEDKLTKQITAIGLGFGFTGLVVILLSDFQALYQIPLTATVLFSIIGLILGGYLHKRKKSGVQSFWSFLWVSFSMWRPGKPINAKKYLIIAIPIGIISFLAFYQAIFTPILHWDATVYHAVIPSIMYHYHGMPLIAGTSVGLEMSANYPPLYYALGAYYYTQVGGVEELYLKAISPTMAVLTILVMLRIGKIIGGETCGKISALLLSATPLFILYSMYVTNYMTYVFFVTASILFMLLAMNKAQSRYWVVCGIFYGLALLSNYQALLLSPLFLLVIIYTYFRGENKRDFLKCLIPIVAVVGVWYLRNLILLGNPIFPLFYEVFGGRYVDPTMRGIVFDSIQYNSVISYFGRADPSIAERLGTFIFNFQHFPSLFLLTFIGIILALRNKNQMRNWTVLLFWAFFPSLLILAGAEWIFPRAFLITLPAFALLTAPPISAALDKLRNLFSLHKNRFKAFRYHWKENLMIFLVGMTLTMCVLFPGLIMAITGKMTYDAPFVEPPDDPLYYIKNPGVGIGEWYHGVDTTVWTFLNDNLRKGEKVATFESKIYYIKGGDYNYFFSLDGWKASKLYNITEPAEMVKFLKSNNVTYIFDSPWTHGALWSHLPLTREDPSKNYTNFLGTYWFPTAFDPVPPLNNTDGGTLYYVGPTIP